MILSVPSAANSTLVGFKSRWITLCACAIVHRTRKNFDDPGGLIERLGLAVDLLGEAAAGEILEGEIGKAVVLADVVDLDYVRMFNRRDGFGLAFEPGDILGPGVRAGADHFESDEPVEPRLPCLVHDAHSAHTQHAQDVVTGDLRLGTGRWCVLTWRQRAVEVTGGRIGPGWYGRSLRGDLGDAAGQIGVAEAVQPFSGGGGRQQTRQGFLGVAAVALDVFGGEQLDQVTLCGRETRLARRACRRASGPGRARGP